eukprot:Gb_12208 [translate_table: standard]
MSMSMQTSNGHIQNSNFECKKVHASTCIGTHVRWSAQTNGHMHNYELELQKD